jgi:hypothetical protein
MTTTLRRCVIASLFLTTISASAAVAETPYPMATKDGRERIQRKGTCPTGTSVAVTSVHPSVSSALISELKFTSCLPEKIAAATIGARLIDRDGIEATLARKTVAVVEAD